MIKVVQSYIYKNYFTPQHALLDLLNRLNIEYKNYKFIVRPFTEPYKWKGKVEGMWPGVKLNIRPKDITEELIDRIEYEIGMGANAWDMVDTKYLIASIINTWSTYKEVK